MSFPAPGNAAIGEELRDEGGIRKALLNWFAQQGINPFQNPYAARLVGRSGEIANIMPGYFAHDDDRLNFINQWAAQNWGGAKPGGGLDFSRQGIINQIDQYGDVNGTPTNLFRSGDSDADAQAIAAWRNIANRGYGSQIQNTAARLEAEKGLQFGAWRQQNPTWSGQYADWRLGKTPVTQGFTPPSGSGAGTGFTPPATTPPVNPNLTTFPSAPGNPWEAIANPPAGGTTPSAPGNAPAPNPQYGQPAPGTPGTPGAPSPQGYGGFSTERGTVAGNPALIFKQLQDIVANASGHITAPGQSSMILPGGWQYSAPHDVARRYWVEGSTGREPGGAAKGTSGWNLLKDWIANLTRNNPGITPDQAMAQAMQFLSKRAGGDPAKLARFGFSRIG
jgi:hypothetical protein